MSDLDVFQGGDFSSDYRLRALCSMIPGSGALLDIGSGNGILGTHVYHRFNSITLSDYSQEIVEMLKKRFTRDKKLKVLELNAEEFVTKEKYNTITVCDVLEHLDDDGGCLRSCRDALAKNGVLFITVPAFQYLYGLRDKKYGHRRRYSKKDLRKVLEENGYSIQSLYYWNCIGVVPYLVSEKIFSKPLHAPARSGDEGVISKIINKFLYAILMVESFTWVPFGLTLVAVCRKKS